MKLKKIIPVIVAVLILTVIIVWGVKYLARGTDDADKDAFVGSRTVTYVIDKSDMDNFIDGGRAAFDLVLRSNAPSWLKYDLSAEEREVYLSMTFEFTTLSDYSDKLSSLLTYYPNLAYSADEFMLMEGFYTVDLLNFLQAILNSLDCLQEKQLSEMFAVTLDEISINAEIYQSKGDYLSITPDAKEAVKLDTLDISTTVDENGIYSRTIMVQMNTTLAEQADVKAVVKRFRKLGKPTYTELSDHLVEASITFEASDQNDLLTKTMYCLNVPNIITQQQRRVDNRTVGVIRTEHIDMEALLREGGSYRYTFQFTDDYRNAAVTDERVSLAGTEVYAEDVEEVSFYYERGFQFQTVDVLVDLSNAYGKITKTITLTAPTELAMEYHDIIKDKLEDRMISGTVMNIYDFAGKRYYEMTFSSWFTAAVREFTEEITEAESRFELQDSWLVFGKSYLQDDVSMEEIVPGMILPERMTVTYVFPNSATIVCDANNSDNAVRSGQSVRFEIEDGDRIAFEYHRPNLAKCILEAAVLLIFLSIVCMIVCKVKKVRGNAETHQNTSDEKLYLCAICGGKIDYQQKYCENCGTPIQW